MAITRNSFTGLQVSELEGVEVSYFTVDYINSMENEVGDPLADSDLSGLALVQQAIMNQGINILGMGPLGNSNTEQTFMVRTDSLDVANHITANGLRDAIRAVDEERAGSRSPSATANLATATVTAKTLTIAV
tara:strand:- start:1 stop:399 length:399 start_codon:yes stop_codon:yes gene_type:complete